MIFLSGRFIVFIVINSKSTFLCLEHTYARLLSVSRNHLFVRGDFVTIQENFGLYCVHGRSLMFLLLFLFTTGSLDRFGV